MFDPTIYGLLPLPVNGVLKRENTHDGVILDEKALQSQIPKDKIIKPESALLRKAENASRKTSTASECTSQSDYTPENTVIGLSDLTVCDVGNGDNLNKPENNKPIHLDTSACTAESSVGLSEIPKQIINPDSMQTSFTVMNAENVLQEKGSEKSKFNQSSTSNHPSTVPADSKPVRKISRFLISPVAEKVKETVEANVNSATDLLTQASNIIEAGMSDTSQCPVKTYETSTENQMTPVGNQHINTNNAVAPDVSVGICIKPIHQEPIPHVVEQVTSPIELKPVGPEMINTLEQLKIGLENITHAHVVPTKTYGNDNFSYCVKHNANDHCLVSDATQTSDVNLEQSSHAIEINNSEIKIEDNMIQSCESITKFPEDSSNVVSECTTLDSVSNPIGSLGNTTHSSQHTSNFNSRRTSTDMNHMELGALQSKCMSSTETAHTDIHRVLTQQNSQERPDER